METQTKHTPGPWEVVDEFEVQAGPYRIIQHYDPAHEPLDATDVAPNARLIAASPQLAEAAALAERVLSDYVDRKPVEMCEMAEAMEALRETLRAAGLLD